MTDVRSKSTRTIRRLVRAPSVRPPATNRPSAVRSAHLVGICGSGMKALAEYLADREVTVTGSDAQQSSSVMRAMQRRGLRVHAGHHDRFLPESVDVLVHSPAVGPENPERRRAAQLGIPQFSYSEMLGWLSETKTGVAIAGTHGKSTTTAMVASILGEAGRDPSAIIGAELAKVHVSGWAGSGREFVLEACEYKRSFLDVTPTHAAILNVEPDHFDYYANAADLDGAFGEFAAKVPADGRLVVRADCARSRSVALAAGCPVVTFGTDPIADWWIGDAQTSTEGTRYRVYQHGDYAGTVRLRVPGRHNALNAIAAIAVCDGLDVPFDAMRESLAEFPGVRRRFEEVGRWRGMTIVDDYAHHPTAVAATLRAARERYGRRRIWCAFQPHQVSRLRELMDAFAGSFADADEVLIAPVFAAREANGSEPYEAAGELAEKVASNRVSARRVASLDHLVSTIDDETAPGDVLITMGAGDIDRVHHEFTRRLRGDYQGR